MDNNNPAPIAAAPAKSGKGAVIGMVICSILALAGVGFGVYEMMNKPATQDLKIQVKDTDGEITTIETDKIEKTDDGKTITIADSVAETSSKDYIYVGRWGLKIKVGDELEEVTYKFGYDPSTSAWSLQLSGGLKGGQDLYEFSLIDKCSLGAVTKVKKEHSESYAHYGGKLVMTDGDYEFYYSHPQDICGPEWSKESETKVAEAIERILTNPDNYTKF